MLKHVRESQSVPRQQLAGAAKVSRQTIHNWENGTGEPNLAQATMMADYLGVDVVVFTTFVKDR